PFTSAFGCRLIVPNFFLCRIACFSIVTSASRSAIVISVSSQRATSFWCLVCTVTSAICRYLSVERITCTLPELPTIFAIRANPASVCSFSFLVMVVCLPVYSTSIRSPRSCDLARCSQTTSVHDVGAYLESAYLPGTSPRSFGSPGFPAAATRPPADRPSTVSFHPLLQSAFSPCVSAAPEASLRLPGHSRLRKRRSATQTRPETYAHTYSQLHGSPSKDE